MSNAQDSIIAELFQQCKDVRAYFATELSASVTEFFDNIYQRGDRAANCLKAVVLEKSAWHSEAQRLHAEDDLFQLLLAKLMESGHDLDGRALRGISPLLIADTDRLKGLIDDDSFEAILASLDFRLPTDVKSQATLTASKYIDSSSETAAQYFSTFVTKHVSKQKTEDYVIAFSAAATIFGVAPEITAPLFLTEGFLPSVLPQMDRKRQSPEVIHAFLMLLNAACINAACRTAIQQYGLAWLSDLISNGHETQIPVAATVMAKLRAADSGEEMSKVSDANSDVETLVRLFKTSLNATSLSSAPDSIEGLAYASFKPDVREELAKDEKFLRRLYATLKEHSSRPEVVLGGLSILNNIVQYLPTQTEEQKKMAQLKAYANASTPAPMEPLLDENHVAARNILVVEAGLVPMLVQLDRAKVAAASKLIAKILLSVSKSRKIRGKVAQQGAVRMLISIATNAAPDSAERFEAAHALARILISVNPTHVFPSSGVPHITSALPPLVSLLKPPTSAALADQPRDLLPVFESLLALTNLASSPDPLAATVIVRTAWDAIEDHLLSSKTMIRRATCELVCNLTPGELGAAKFADGTKRAGQRLHMLLALADVDDVATRRAAGGALAMLTEFDAVISALLDIKRGIEILLSLCKEEEEEIVHRGLFCVRNLSCAPGETGERARTRLRKEGGIETIKASLRIHNNPNLLQAGVGALKPLIEDRE